VEELLERLKTALADRYVIKHELGAGGMATVYLADDVRHGRQVALKLLKPELGAVLGGGRFLREIHIAAGLNHPHILGLHDSGEVDGLLFYVMPYVAGESLRQKLERQTQLPIEEAIETTRQVASALDYAHRQGVVHRDIKPENILLQEGHAVVADFGIARALRVAGGERLTETGLSLGTPHYMSPEQATGTQELDGRSDVYSLACVLYEMLAGDPPFLGPTAPAIIARQLVDPPPSLRTVRQTVPEELERAIEKALAKVPADRYDTAGAFVEAAGEAARVEVVPTRERRAPRRRAWPKTWRVVVPAALAGAAAITAGVVLLVSGVLRGSPQITFSNIRQITRDPGMEYEPVISPDGEKIAYIGRAPDGVDVFVKDLAGGRALPLTAGCGDCYRGRPRWTPDGRSIVFSEDEDVGAFVSYAIPWLGGPMRTITASQVWDVHGNRVAYYSGDSILARDLDGGEPVLLNRSLSSHSGTWSPDGSRLAFVRGATGFVQWGSVGNSSILIVNEQGGDRVPVVDHASLNVSPVWMPDGDHLLFVSDREGARDIYMVRVGPSGLSRGEPVRITTGLNPHSISLSEDGGTLVYSQFILRRNIWKMAMPDSGAVLQSQSELTPVTVGNQAVENSDLSADGRWLAFDSDLEGNYDIYIVSVDGGEPRPLTTHPADDWMGSISRDGSEIAFDSWRDDSPDLYLISADGTGEVRLTSDSGLEAGPRFSPDGLQIAFMATQARGWTSQIFVMGRDSVGAPWGAPRQLTTSDLKGKWPGGWSPDGRQISYYSGRTYDAIMVVTLDGQEREIFSAAAAGFTDVEWPTWSEDGRSIYLFTEDSSGTDALYKMPAAGGTPQPVIRFDDRTRRVPYAPTIGHGMIYLPIGEMESDIYVMDVEIR